MATQERLLSEQDTFPMEVFIRRNREDPMRANPHWHDCFEILYVLQGQARYIAEEKACDILPGDFILIRCGDIHTVVCPENGDADILVVKFMPAVISSPYHRLSGSRYISAFLNNDNVYHLEADEQTEIREILEGINREYTEKKPAYELVVRSGVYRLIAACIRHRMIVLPEHASTEQYDALLPVLQYIERHYDEEITLRQIADMLHLNYTYTSRYFRKIVGRSFKQYLDYIRVSEAEKQLLQGGDYAYIVARRCGFSSQQTFIRTFKRLRGYTPKVKKCSTPDKN